MRAEVPAFDLVIITLDMHLHQIALQVAERLRREVPGLRLSFHAAAEWDSNIAALERCRADVAKANLVLVSMLFMDEQVRAILPALQARRELCDAMVITMSAPELVKLTRMGGLRLDAPESGAIAALKKLRGGSKGRGSGAGQMAMLRRLPKILSMIPGKAQDLRAYFLAMQYWLAGSEVNMANLLRFLVGRYAAGERAGLRSALPVDPPVCYPDVGLYHPSIAGGICTDLAALPIPAAPCRGTVGLLVLRSYVLAEDTAHYDGVIAALEARGLRVIPAFASGLDARPAIDKFFYRGGRPQVDLVLSLTGFSLVGGPAYNDSAAAEESLARMDVPYLSAQSVEFQTLEAWSDSPTGLTPVEATIMVALPELDGAVAPIVFGGRSIEGAGVRKMRSCPDRVAMLADRAERLIALRRRTRAERKLAVVLFNFPPNAGASGTAAYLSVFASLFNLLVGLKKDGYDVDPPADPDALRKLMLGGNAALHGTDANVHAAIPVEDHIRREPYLAEIEKAWGPAPGRQSCNGNRLFVQGVRLGNIFIGLQPGFGYEGDPMRMLFEGGLAPTHAFSAFYRYIREDFAADAVLHFGTHGALEFMPGKQVGLSRDCWPDRLIGCLPSYYLYAANNPSEGAIAKRRASATLISYLTPPVTQAGLYKGLAEIKSSIQHWRAGDDALLAEIKDQADLLCLEIDPAEWADPSRALADLSSRLYEFERTLIPEGLHVVGEAMDPAARRDTLMAMAEAHHGISPTEAALDALVAGEDYRKAARLAGAETGSAAEEAYRGLAEAARHLAEDSELPALLHALDGGFVRPVAGGDLIRNQQILPTGRNLHGFDPMSLPSATALRRGRSQAGQLLERHAREGAGSVPESVAFVLWGTDNLKSEGEPIAQVLALMGARVRVDSYGRLCGAELIPLAELGRPRIDVVATLSGIFRDILPLQTKMLAEAAFLAASADEPVEANFIRKHALAYQAALGCDLETAALRVFSNADGAYGSNVNHLIDSGCWDDGDELADMYEARKCFAYGRSGRATRQPALLGQALSRVDLAYQNLESMELGVTTIDHYVDTLGGITRSVKRAKGEDIPVFVGDHTQGQGKVRTLSEQVALETRTRTLNPRWYDGLLEHGYEGVRQIEAHVANTLGWSATTGQVAEWTYQKISETFVLDETLRNRLVELNPKASARIANRLLEACERRFWTPDAATLEALRRAGDEIEDRIETAIMAAE